MEAKKANLAESVQDDPPEEISEEQQEIWDLKRAGFENDMDTLSVIASLIQQSITLTGQAANKVTYLRRVWNYAALPNTSLEDAKSKIKDSNDILKLEETLLFGDKFAERQKLQTTQINSVAQNIRVEKDLKGMAKGKSPSSKTAKELKMPFRGSSARGAATGRGHGDRSSWANSSRGSGGSSRGFGGVFRGSNNWNRGGSNANRGGKIRPSCSPFPKKVVSSWFPTTPSWGGNKTVFRKLGKTNQRSRNPGNSKGMENPTLSSPNTGSESSSNCFLSRRERGSVQGNKQNVGKESHPNSKTPRGSVHLRHLHETKSGGRLQNHPEPEEVKSEDRLLPFQDGRSARPEKLNQTERPDVKNRSEGCVLVSPCPPLIEEVHEVPMGGDPLRVHSPSLRVRPGSDDLHKMNEGADMHFEKVECEGDRLLRRSPPHREFNGRDSDGQRLYHFPFAKPRFYDKPCQILFDSIAQMFLSRDVDRQCRNVDKTSGGEDKKVDLSLLGHNQDKNCLSEIPIQDHRKIAGDSPSNPRSGSSDQRSTTEPDQSSKASVVIRITDNNRQTGDQGTDMVETQLVSSPRMPDQVGTPSNANLHRCIKTGLGSPCIGGV